MRQGDSFHSLTLFINIYDGWVQTQEPGTYTRSPRIPTTWPITCFLPGSARTRSSSGKLLTGPLAWDADVLPVRLLAWSPENYFSKTSTQAVPTVYQHHTIELLYLTATFQGNCLSLGFTEEGRQQVAWMCSSGNKTLPLRNIAQCPALIKDIASTQEDKNTDCVFSRALEEKTSSFRYHSAFFSGRCTC